MPSVLTAGDHIRSLLGRYCDLVDAGDWDAVGTLFAAGRLAAEDGTVLASGADEVAAFYRRGTKLHEGVPGTKHLVANTQLASVDDGAVEARSSYLVLQAVPDARDVRPVVTGRYVDRFEAAEDGAWTWVERRFAVDLAGDLSHHLTWSPPT